MAQDEPQSDRVERIARALSPHFDHTCMGLARQIAQAEDGRLIEQTEMPIFEQMNRLKTKCQQVGLQERIDEAEAAFPPSGQTRKTS